MEKIYNILSLVDLPNEIWKDIPNYEGYYQVSNLGRIKRLKRIISACYGSSKTIKDIIIKQELTKKGYLRASLFKNGIKEKRFVHRLVAQSFIGFEENKTINHKNGIKFDNNIENLEWLTQSENCKHAYKNGLSKIMRGAESHRFGKCGSLHKHSKKVLRISGEEIIEYESMSIAAKENNLKTANISKVCYNLRHTCGGFKWKFI